MGQLKCSTQGYSSFVIWWELFSSWVAELVLYRINLYRRVLLSCRLTTSTTLVKTNCKEYKTFIPIFWVLFSLKYIIQAVLEKHLVIDVELDWKMHWVPRAFRDGYLKSYSKCNPLVTGAADVISWYFPTRRSQENIVFIANFENEVQGGGLYSPSIAIV